jgi:hypothetical protein
MPDAAQNTALRVGVLLYSVNLATAGKELLHGFRFYRLLLHGFRFYRLPSSRYPVRRFKKAALAASNVS